MQLELLQPVSGYCIYDEHLERKGEGLHHIKLYHADYAAAVADYAGAATRSPKAAASTRTSTTTSIPSATLAT